MEKQNAYGEQKKTDSFRRNWDTESYEKKARDREQQLRIEEEDERRRRKGLKSLARQPADAAKPREMLQARKQTVDLEGMVGKVQVVQASSAASGQPGFYCSVCDVTVKDSLTYLDHINGKNHQRMLNRGMKVASETVDDVLAKLESLRRIRKQRLKQSSADYDFHEQVKRQELLKEEKRQRRKRAQAQKKKKRQQHKSKADDGEEIDTETGSIDDNDDMLAAMGFSSFGASKRT
ncbi:U4/U6.U5 snRNP associated protein [Coemansia erecta]|uniref:U4/U6.U5 snRNP associated protein n=1 Tax=Coemansia asiatica TaxID=1052880 RepID=A0A9W8CL62_9FUNG|nr:U4/U6.U5 snRNP associated protein [Coemansia asiatica]KAJ2856057.1 U4/U6.U5 snRNP associated protein [Coemansia asiatica]KAJ2856929.1 U4/U6.U5 snRNP associated protein [Coemansia erecta]